MQLAKLDALLIPDPAFATTPLVWLRNAPTAPKPDHVRVLDWLESPEFAPTLPCRAQQERAASFPNIAIFPPVPIVTSLLTYWEWRSLDKRLETAPFLGRDQPVGDDRPL